MLLPETSCEDTDLVARVLANDARAFEELAARHSPRLGAVARRILRDPADADEAVHDALVQVFRALARFDGRSRLSTWMHRIVVNAALRLRERRARGEMRLDDQDDERDASFSAHGGEPAQALLGAELREIVRRHVDRLPRTYREVVVLRDLQEKSTVEAARILGISCVNVRARLHRAHRELREALRGIGIEAA
jgi:RNA polymerase sigma-70 factor (ECF subfamily)